MNNTVIYKYPLKYTKITLEGEICGSSWEQEQILELPVYAEILKADLQNNNLVIWAKINPNTQYTEKFLIEIVGTGQEIKNPEASYINTFYDNGLVFHVFAIKPNIIF